jgi:hypothetical protein
MWDCSFWLHFKEQIYLDFYRLITRDNVDTKSEMGESSRQIADLPISVLDKEKQDDWKCEFSLYSFHGLIRTYLAVFILYRKQKYKKRTIWHHKQSIVLFVFYIIFDTHIHYLGKQKMSKLKSVNVHLTSNNICRF